jgi:hypothetical protein
MLQFWSEDCQSSGQNKILKQLSWPGLTDSLMPGAVHAKIKRAYFSGKRD